MKKICVFPNDPLSAYFKKGEVKKRYFNPLNIFDEVHVISLFDQDEIEENVKDMAGNAEFNIHVIGKTNLLNKNRKKSKVMELLKKINPDVIRAYNPLLQGWMAAHAKKELDIPLVISLHGDYDRDLRHYAKKNKDFKTFLKLSFSKLTLERFSIKSADEVIIIYEFIRDYAKRMGARSINLIYNRVDLAQFSNKGTPAYSFDKPVVICVGRLMKEKNQECLIKAVKDLDVILLLIGDGIQYNELVELTKSLGIEDKVKFVRSVPHKEIQKYYASAKIFALPIKYGGFSIPALEAAASGLPVILPKQKFDENPEIIRDFAMLVNNDPNSFKEAISKILTDNGFYQQMVDNGKNITKKINSEIMEQKESELYSKLLEN